jgi:NAD(P)H-dependent FMN reductase
MKKILIILGSTRQGRRGELVAKWVKKNIDTLKEKSLKFNLADLRERNLPFYDSPIPPMMGQYPKGRITDWAKEIASYDGILIITPEYNHGYPAVLKNALDVIYKEWNYKPVSFISYGASSGGIRAIEQLRQVVIELKMIPLKEELSIPFIWQVFDEKGNMKNSEHAIKALKSILEAYTYYFNNR